MSSASETNRLEPLNSAAALWSELIRKAGLTATRNGKSGSYDKGLISLLQERLFPGQSGDFEALLSTADLSAEVLLRAFFATLEPFAAMKKDILAMLADAGARTSGDNLQIRFHFDPDSDPLDLLLEQFRTQMEHVARASIPAAPQVDYGELWSLTQAGFEDEPWSASGPADPYRPDAMIAWISAYEKGEPFRPLDVSGLIGDGETDKRVDRVLRLMNAILGRFSLYGRTREALRDAAQRPDAQEVDDASGFSIYQLWVIESDFWPLAILRWIDRVRDVFALGDLAGIKRICERVDAILPASDESSTRDELVRLFDDILDLPVWKHRHEVYAVWLGAQIYGALSSSGWKFRFHLVEDRLEFAFRGVHLATLHRGEGDPVLFWWTELGSRHDDLPNPHRTTGIQPDYRIRSAPLSALQPDILVVEAKQHLRSSNKEFKEALEDYAHACPRAGVLLANHGPCSESLMAKIAPAARRRSAAHGDVHPGEPEQVKRFGEDIVRVVEHALAGNAAEAFTSPWGIALSWGAAPADLDLHLFKQAGAHLFYQERRCEGAELGADVTTGYGPEVAIIRAEEGRYDVWVHQFSDSGDLSTSEAVVEITFGPDDDRSNRRFEVPTGDGRWWHVACIDLATFAIVEAQSRACQAPTGQNGSRLSAPAGDS